MMDIENAMERYSQPGRGEATIFIHKNNVVRTVNAQGVKIEAESRDNEVHVNITVSEKIDKVVHLCFAILREEGEQRIKAHIKMEDGTAARFLSHCVFPAAKKIRHDSEIHVEVGNGAHFNYEEEHIHSNTGEIVINSHVIARVGIKGSFELSFTAKKGRAGTINAITDVHLLTEARANIIARIAAKSDDAIALDENMQLAGCSSKGIIKTRVVLREHAKSVVRSEIVGEGTNSRGHIDCTEILMDHAEARAEPNVYVKNPRAKLTHEAAIGRIDDRQITTLMCRGLSEDEATDIIVEGILR
ncbi:MAG: hypothetical protein GXO25_00105 [Euryarchaeota archaeon]|nr:hypothetical protein [Euryarchaeota archaeon]